MKSQANRTKLQRLIAGVGAVSMIGAAACATTVDKSPSEEAGQTQEPSAQESQNPRAHRHHKGPVSLVVDAARMQGNLTVSQSQSLTLIETELREDHASRRAFGEKMRSSAVAVLRAGTTDSEQFDKTVVEAVSAIETRMRKSADAMEEIHATLDPEQRAQVATVLHARIDEKFGVKPDQEKRKAQGVRKFAGQLMLSAFQVDKLKAMKTEWLGEKQELRPSREELHSLVTAFEGDEFSTSLNAFLVKKTAILNSKVAKAGERTDSVLSVFTPEQRNIIADLILDGPRKVFLGDPEPTR